eukprot:6905131-Prymnesium_polylepis.1
MALASATIGPCNYSAVIIDHSRKTTFWKERRTRMAQRWPSASGPARDARMFRAPARGAPAISAPEARRSTCASPRT